MMPVKSDFHKFDEIRALAKLRNVPIVMLIFKKVVRMTRVILKKGPNDSVN